MSALAAALLAVVLLGAAMPAAAHADGVVLPSCAWQGGDRIVNALYPDEDAAYYTAVLPALGGASEYRIRGRFPHARYISFVAYDGLPMDALADAEIAPDPGHSNPFVTGAKRTAKKRSYTLRIVNAPVPETREPNTLYVGAGQLGLPQRAFYVFYRVYVPDRGLGWNGGVALPSIELIGGPSVTVPEGVCGTAPPTSVPDTIQQAYAGASVPAVLPPLPRTPHPPEWTVESGLTAAALGAVGGDGAVTGGPGSNPHSRYISAYISRGHGAVLAIRGKAARAPATYDGQRRMGSGDVRYWSFCQNSRTTRYVACLSDTDVELDDDGYYTIAISDPADRPPSARNWLPFGPEPEGQVLYRHMLPSPAFFPFSAQGAAASGLPLEQSMGDYYPRAAYCSTERFAQDACGLNN